VRQLLTESVLLAAAGAAIGTALAYAGLPAILALVPPGTIPDEAEIAINAPVLIVTLLVTAATSLLCGLAPALHSSRSDLSGAMREASRTLAGGSRQAILRKGLVIAEVALALVLLAGSSLLLRTFVAMQQVDLAYPPDRLLTFRVPLPAEHYPDAARRVAFFQQLFEKVRAVPGVRSVGLNTGFHPVWNMQTGVEVSGEPPNRAPVMIHQINTGYQDAFTMASVSGRLFTDADIEGAQPVALVNERFARTRLVNRSALGQQVRIPRIKELPFGARHESFQIVGIVRDTPNNGLAEPVMPEMYIPFTVTGLPLQVAIRADVEPLTLTRLVTRQVQEVDAAQPVTNLATLETVIRESEYATPRFNLVLLSVFAAVGLALAVVGVYGVMSSAVAQETHEIGIRMALGADSGSVSRMIIGRGARLLLAGTAIGVVASYAAGRYFAGEVWNVSSFDPLAVGGVSLLLLLVGLQACYWPARRAAKTDPLIALRQE
jgi:putative ABC transport system permease protein